MTTDKIRLDPDLLTPRDLRRAREVLKGRNPFELLADPIDRVVLITWCLRSREDPSFTWDQAEDTPFSTYEQVDEEDEKGEIPSIPGPATSGASEPGTNGNAASPLMPPADVPVSSSSPSSG